MRIIFRLIYCSLFLCSFGLFAKEAKSPVFLQENLSFNQRQMLSDLEFITHIFQVNYAPLDWKASHFGWDLSSESLKAQNSIKDDPYLTTKECQKIIKNLCLTAKDYHLVPQFYSTEWSSLPFTIQSANGKYFISHVDHHRVSSLKSLAVGDQVLFLDGTPIGEVLENFWRKEIGSNYFETDRALAEFYLTTRLGCSGHEVPKGMAELVYCKNSSDKRQQLSLEWDYHTEMISNARLPLGAKSLSQVQSPLSKSLFQKQFMTPHFSLMRKVHTDRNEPSDLLGARKSRVPVLGEILWQSDENSEFYAYLFAMEEWQVGYIRIPSYHVDGNQAALEFAELIEHFQEASDLLVIDQLNNGGGLVLYLYALLAMLTDHALDIPMHRVMLTQHDVYFSTQISQVLESVKNDRTARRKLGTTLEGIVVNYHLVKSLLNSHEFIIDQWNQGKLLTDFCYLYGIEKIIPHPEVNYRKPILVLTNGLNFSAADFFAAIMQDGRRAKIMGTRTAGAGGYIEKVSFPNLNGIEEINFTASFSKRPNGMPIENLGVTPDILCEVTQNDLQNDYADYKQKILHELKCLLTEQ